MDFFYHTPGKASERWYQLSIPFKDTQANELVAFALADL